MSGVASAPLAVGARPERVAAAFDAAGVDLLVVTDATNRRWLTGFTGSAGWCVLRPGRPAVLITDGRYGEVAAEQTTTAAAAVEVEVRTGLDEQLALVADLAPPGSRLGLEAASVSWELARRVAGALVGREVVATARLVEAVRARKEPAEVARIEAAARAAESALDAVSARLADGPTERDIAEELVAALVAAGADGPAFAPIVASGPLASRPHGEPSERRVRPGDLVVIDVGGSVDGYASDTARTVAVGDVDGALTRLLDVADAAQAAGLAVVAPGVTGHEVDAACRAVVEEAGLGAEFVHATGHGIGLDVHEYPRLGRASADRIEEGHVVTVEPGVYRPHVGGARLEDLVLVTATGARLLTAGDRRPRVPAGP